MIRQSTVRFTVTVLLLGIVATAIPVLADNASTKEKAARSAENSHFVVYYFYGNMRCATCRKLEAYSEEAITKGFPEQLESGDLEWRAVNTDEPDHKHFVEDFQLVTKSLVVVEYRDDEVVRFENLKKIWQKVSDKEDYLEYVRDNTREFIGQS